MQGSRDVAPKRQAAERPVHSEAADTPALEQSVDRLTASIRHDTRTRHIAAAYLPDRQAVIGVLEHLIALMYPGFFGRRDLSDDSVNAQVGELVHEISVRLGEQVSAALRYDRRIEPGSRAFDRHCADSDARAGQIVRAFAARLPAVRDMLSLDVQAAHDGDPAARDTDEIIFCYPGMRALTIHRLAHELYRLEVPLVPRIMSEHAHSVTGIDIHPGARIGKSFFIDHGTGVVIGETTVIGDHCRIYQGVTLGARHFEKDERGRLRRDTKRHPTLEDHVTVFAGATILGGETVIGAGSVVNGGVFLTSSVPAGHIVRGPKADISLRNNPDLPPPMYSI